jgi:hypothetical protein
MTTAKYGRKTAPKAGINNHQPRANNIAMMQTTLMLMASVYFSIREWRSCSGDGGSDVMD